MKKNDITIKIDSDKLKNLEALATLRMTTAEELIQETIEALLNTVDASLKDIEKNLFQHCYMI